MIGDMEFWTWKAGFTYDGINYINEVEKMDEYIKESVNEMYLIIGKNKTNDFLIVDENLITVNEKIQLQNYFENNLSEDDEYYDKEEVFYEETISIKTYKDALIEIKKIYNNLLLTYKMLIFFKWFLQSNNTWKEKYQQQ